jgi:Xaa-Pro aminopeptidase
MKAAPLTNVARLRRLLDTAPLDAVIASSPENLAYCSGYYGADLFMLKERQYFAVWIAGGEPAWIAPSYRAAGSTFIEDVRHYDFYARRPPAERDGLGYVRVDQSPVPALVEALSDRGLSRARIGIEHKHLWPEHLLALRGRLPDASFVDCTLFFESVRMFKTLETYRRLYDGVHVPLLAATRAGITGAGWYAQARVLFERAVGEVPWGMIAHGLGLDIHERPWCHPFEEFVLEPGMGAGRRVDLPRPGPDVPRGGFRHHA